MKKHISHSFWSCLSFGAFILAASNLQGQSITYLPSHFDTSISLGCNCTCLCETNTIDTNNPVSVFLAANPVASIASTAVMPAIGQVVPPHWTEFLDLCSPPLYGSSYNITYGPEGWTKTLSRNNSQGSTPFDPVNFNLNYPIVFNYLNYSFYADALHSAGSGAGPDPVQSQTKCQPYPWDVNLTLQLQNGQLYYMEQQLVVGYAPVFDGQALHTPVTYVETNSLLTISLYCTNGGVVEDLPLKVSRIMITATLLPDNIPAPLSLSDGWVFTSYFYTNWDWPLTFDDLTAPNSLVSPPGAAGTVQASLDLGAGNIDNDRSVSNVNLLVRADRAYQIALTYFLGPNSIRTLYVANTGVVPPCTNVSFVFYTDICSYTNPTPNLCWATNVGKVDMMGAPDDPPGITMWALGAGRIFSTNLTGSALSGLPGTPVPFQLPVFMVDQTINTNFEKWATESLDHGTAYEYFRSPSVHPVTEECSKTNNLGNDFVICPTNPAVVKGSITLNGCVDTNYYNGQAALSFLQFADYDANGLPQDPAGNADERLQNVSSIQATNGAGALPFTNRDGFAITEFDNPGGFAALNSYTGQYSLKLGGLQSLPCVWNVNDLHLVFGDPVKLAYHVFETDSRYTNVNISCATIVTNNIALCFGLKKVHVVNAYPTQPDGIPVDSIYHDAIITVSGTGPGYTVGPFTSTNQFATMLPTDNHCDIDLFLPEGNYQYTADVNIWSYDVNNVYRNTSTLHLAGTNYFTVNCCTNPCLLVDCPTNITVYSCTNVPVLYSGLAYTDFCCTNPTVVYNPSNGSYFFPGTTRLVTTTVSDTCGNTNTCQFTVTVVCITNPPPQPGPGLHNWNVDGTTSGVAFDLGAGYRTFMFTNGVWITVGGNVNYILENITNLLSTNWMTVCNATPTLGFTFTNTGPLNFYRLELRTN